MTTTSSTSGSADRFDDDLDLLSNLLEAQGIELDEPTGIARRAAGALVPMSFSQELIWLLDRATPGLTAYNLTIARRLRGPVDVAALERAVTFLVARHESLRVRFADIDGAPRLLIDEPPSTVPLRVVDVSSRTAEDRVREAERLAREWGRTPFDLTSEHLFRPSLIRLDAQDHVLVLASHHIVLDGWSMGILFRELSTAYAAFRAGRSPDLPALPIEFGDYALWQREHLAGERLERLLAFWRTQLGDATEPLALPTDAPRPSVPNFAGARQTLVLSSDVVTRMKTFAQRHDATLYMVLLAGYATVLHRYTGRENVLIGSGSAGRTLRDTESLVGYLNNTLVQRANFSGNPTFAELLGRVREGALGAYDHQDVPLEKLVLELRSGQERLADAPLFEVVLTMQDTNSGGIALEGLDVEPFGVDMGGTKFDLTLLPAEHGDGLSLSMQYRSELFTAATIRRLLGHLTTVLDAAMRDPNVRVTELPLLTAEELTELRRWSISAETTPLGTDTPMPLRVEHHAARTPQAPALHYRGESVTYDVLNTRANQLAHRLQHLGAGPGTTVGVNVDRSADMIVTVLAVLKTGAAYVPLPPELPPARLVRQLQESGTRIVVGLAESVARLHTGMRAGEDRIAGLQTIALDTDAGVMAQLPTHNLGVAVAPEHIAYVLYTSGSTGTPKGVAVTHANLTHYTNAIMARLDISGAHAPLSFATVSTLGADLGNTAIFPALASGGTLHIVPVDVTTEPARFGEYMTTHAVDVLKITPSHIRALMTGSQGDAALPRQWLVVGGEACPWDLAEQVLRANRCRFLNHYGPTESTVGCLTFEVTANTMTESREAGALTAPIGRPLAGARSYVVDGHGNLMPIGIPGELYIGGDGVVSGYLNRPELTEQRFCPDTFGGSANGRVYRSGDRVRWLATGTIEFLGRFDHQVKVRGYRVELGEIEQVLREHAAVSDSAVLLTGQDLAGFVVLTKSGYAAAHADRPTPKRIREWLSTRVPEYMVPSHIMILEDMPLTANGKQDRTALLAMVVDQAGSATNAYVAPVTPEEISMAQVWAEVLKVERVGLRDNFLTLGGHSLLAIRMLGKISRTFNVRLPLRALFDAPTVEQLTAFMLQERAKTATSSAPASGGISATARDAFRIRNPSSPNDSSANVGE